MPIDYINFSLWKRATREPTTQCLYSMKDFPEPIYTAKHTHTHTQTPENTLQLRIQGFMKFIGFIYEGKRLTNLLKKSFKGILQV